MNGPRQEALSQSERPVRAKSLPPSTRPLNDSLRVERRPVEASEQWHLAGKAMLPRKLGQEQNRIMVSLTADDVRANLTRP